VPTVSRQSANVVPYLRFVKVFAFGEDFGQKKLSKFTLSHDIMIENWALSLFFSVFWVVNKFLTHEMFTNNLQ
jgi:hypothetical protein